MSNVTLTPTVGAAVLTGVTMAGGVLPLTNTGKLYITEFLALGDDRKAGLTVTVGHCPPLVYQVVNFGTAAALSAPFSARTRAIRVHSDGICALQIGGTLAPVAVAGLTGVLRMAANSTEYFTVDPSAVLSVIAST